MVFTSCTNTTCVWQDYKLNIEPNHTTLAGHDYEHDLIVGSQYGMLGDPIPRAALWFRPLPTGRAES